MYLDYPRDIKYLEGSITEFPSELGQQVCSYDSKIFSRTLWQDRTWKRQCLDTTYEGRPAKFVLNRDATMCELKAGRFRCDNNDQIVVVGLPDEEVEGGLRYVIVARPWNQRDYFNKPVRGTKDWKASAWYVWKPKDRYGKYYKNVPRKILRVQGPASTSGARETDEISPASAVGPPLNLLTQDIVKQDHAISELEAASLATESTAIKRKLSFETDTSQSPKPKKVCEQDKEEQEGLTRASTAPTALVTSSDPTEVQNAPSTSGTTPSTGQIDVAKQDHSHQTAPSETETSDSTNVEAGHETHRPDLVNAETTSSLSPQMDLLRDDHDTDDVLAVVKQEVDDVDFLASPQMSHSAEESLPTNASPRSQSGNLESTSVPIESSSDEKPMISNATPISIASRRTGAADMIDLTGNDDYDAIQQVSHRQINVVFIDKHGKEQHTMSFEECNTAEDMFEEACAWDIADKDTKMLEVTIPGLEPKRIRTNNEKHFAQNVFGRLKHVMSGPGKDQPITLTVQKYM